MCTRHTPAARTLTLDSTRALASRVRKIGEGTFGEAFKAGHVVLKIVPMEGEVLVNGEPQVRWGALHQWSQSTGS